MRKQYPLASDFTLLDTNHQPVSLSQFQGNEIVILILNRGFACPFCRQWMAQLRRAHNSIAARYAVVLFIAPEPPEVVHSFWQREQMPWPGLADPDHAVATLYRQTVDLFGGGRLPATILIDPAGQIRKTYYGTTPADIPSIDALIKDLDAIAKEPA